MDWGCWRRSSSTIGCASCSCGRTEIVRLSRNCDYPPVQPVCSVELEMLVATESNRPTEWCQLDGARRGAWDVEERFIRLGVQVHVVQHGTTVAAVIGIVIARGVRM